MPASVVIVHDDPAFLEEASFALRQVGHDVVTFVDPLIAFAALEVARSVEVLITRSAFARDMPNGLSLALAGRSQRPGLRIVFTALPDYKRFTEGIGEFLPFPVDVPKLVETVTRLMDEGRRNSV
jgi:DNA-binding NtrC family response regulator